MTTHRTCSYTESLIAVSWRVACGSSRTALTEVEVVADTFLNRSRVVALVTVRLAEAGASARMLIDGQSLVTFDLVDALPEDEPAVGFLFRRVLPLAPEFHDGQTHQLRVDVSRQGTPIAHSEMSFYARRASNRRLMVQPLPPRAPRAPRRR